MPVVAVFDAGKTNKKLFLFDEHYRPVYEHTSRFDEIKDEDGDPCEDIHALKTWIITSLHLLIRDARYDIRAINFSSFGASFVHVDENGEYILPLYSYVKPFPASLKQRFFDTYGGEKRISRETASPVLDNLNSGLQLYRLKYERQLSNIKGWSLHLPQYLSFLVSGKYYSDMTSVGCHTMLWNFENHAYHEWVQKEGLLHRLAPLFPGNEVMETAHGIKVGVGLHDSSSALIPYLACFKQPFVLISTGTWSISMNPFNMAPLTDAELEHDCLCYISYEGRPVKSSRLFAGHEHEVNARRLAEHFSKAPAYFETVKFNPEIVARLKKDQDLLAFADRNLYQYESYEEAYHQLMIDIMREQVISTNLVMSDDVTRIFVDGGFGKNEIYMQLLANAYPDKKIYAASIPQATAIGAALAIHEHWNSMPVPDDIIELKEPMHRFSVSG